jgi:homogentisate 1,2-dioxygenase
MIGDISLLVAAGVLLVSAWALLVLYCWLTRSTQFIVREPTKCRGYCCEQRVAADRLTPRNS